MADRFAGYMTTPRWPVAPRAVIVEAILGMDEIDLVALTRMPKLHEILRVVMDVYGLPKSEIFSMRRSVEVVLPRAALFWLAKRYTSHSLPVIGRFVGGRDHTTVLNALSRAQGVLEGGGKPAERMLECERRLVAKGFTREGT